MSHAPEPLPSPAPGAEAPASTKERLLDAAFEVLARHGIEGTSIRAVTRVAGLSVSAANYHFGSKQALVREALRRHLAPMNARRLELLDAAMQAEAPSVESLVDAFLRPSLELRAGEGRDSVTYRRLPGWLHLGSPSETGELLEAVFGEVFERFVAALGEILPGAGRRERALALQYALGALLHTSGGTADHFIDPDGSLEVSEFLDRLVRFAAAGIHAACDAPGGGRE